MIRRSLPPLMVLLLVLAVGLTTGAGSRPKAAAFPPSDPASSAAGGGLAAEAPGQKGITAMRWQEVERLQDEQKFAAAAELVEAMLTEAVESVDHEQWTRALVRWVQLRMALHGYETSVQFLREQAWPDAEPYKSVVRLFYAHSLVTYLRAYSWEIAQREEIDSPKELDLKSWSREQIVAEAQLAFSQVWRQRAQWGDQGLGVLAEYVRQNNYPARIRGTLRDAVTYLWIELLADSSLWAPRHSNQVYRLDREALIVGGADGPQDIELEDPELHPLIKIGAVLDDLERWHRDNGRPEAAFEARLERLRRLHSALAQEDDRLAIRRNLETRLDDLGRHYPWWTMGQATLAEFVQQESGPDALIRARAIALEGLSARPESLGGQRCRHIVAAIEAPDFDLTAMQSDGPDRRSLLVQHRNLDSLYFRAYRLDLLRLIETSQDFNLLPVHREVAEIVERRLPDAEWSVELPPTPDFRSHQTFVTPGLAEPGLHLVVASASRSFADARNRLLAVHLMISDLVLLTRDTEEGFEVVVRSGDSGKSRSGAEVLLYRFDYRRGHRRVDSAITDDQGTVRFAGRGRSRDAYFLLARHGDEMAIDPQALWPQRRPEPGVRNAALIYTDRSVYRPHQRIQWKAVAYRSEREAGRFRTLASQPLTIQLLDPNHQVVASREVRANQFGSASGEFQVPAGHLLGHWRLRASIGGEATIRVEEYKRPTFEVTLLEPGAALRLNRKAEVDGEAAYYFGLPVVGGAVSWRVERVPVYPRWWGHWRGFPRQPAAEFVAAGETETDADGRFRVTFVPAADEREAASPGVSYRFRLSVDIVDEGGETRSAERAFRLGFVAVQATLDPQGRFFVAGQRAQFTVHRSDLDGVPRPGQGAWTLMELRQPERTLLPADQPLPEPPADERPVATPGDLLRPRWAPGYRPEEILSLWPSGRELEAGSVEHADDGLADIALAPLPPGAYRLRYSTVDGFGAELEVTREFVVAADGDASLALPALLLVEASSVSVGGTARLLVHSGLPSQEMVLELFRAGRRIEQRRLSSEAGGRIVEIPILSKHRGGFGVRLTALRDHQLMTFSESVFVPWEDRELRVGFASFRDLLQPGQRETWRLEVSGQDGQRLAEGSAELLAYMYDRSLDIFAPHQPPEALSLYPNRTGVGRLQVNLGSQHPVWSKDEGFRNLPGYPHLSDDRLIFFDGYGIGGPGLRMGLARSRKVITVTAEAPLLEEREQAALDEMVAGNQEAPARAEAGAPEQAEALRSDFSETAFWEPHLLLGEGGTVAFEFTVPDSVTEWNVWVHALTRDLRGGSLREQARSVKELMVRPYLPRFLREGDRADLKVVVNNASDGDLSGTFDFDIRDAASGASVLAEFGIDGSRAHSLPFQVERGGTSSLSFAVTAPARVGQVVVEVKARAGRWSDGERRPLPLLPGRMRLSQSRFAALRDADRRELHFADLAADDDPSRIHEQLVVTLDAQLFYGVLQALPYLATYPYECTEQTLNRFLSAGIVASLYDAYPAVARMAREFSQRQTRYEIWDARDPNRKMALEETPWLRVARGGEAAREDLINVLDPGVARAERRAALAKLAEAQTSLGGFPWWPGGPPSPFMTLYILNGFSRALEFEIDIPREMVVRAWGYMHRHYVDELVQHMMADDCCWETITFLNYILSAYPDSSWTGEVFTRQERDDMLRFAFRHWRRHSPLLKSYLALTLLRADRPEDAALVFQSVMDSSRTTRDEGTFWAPEDRAWLWYNDTIETHAFALRTLMEIDAADDRRHGLVQWLFLNKKLQHWKSTRATAEVIYSLVHYLEQEDGLGQREAATVRVGERSVQFVFEPDTYSGANNRLVVAGEQIDPVQDSTVVVEKTTPGLMFASATWHFSTQELPAEARGDLFSVERRYFRRVGGEGGWTLQPLAAGARLEIGDQVEVHLSLRSRHAAEYVHLRDPRAAGLEPVTTTSGYRWDLGLGWYEEIRDSGTNFFFEWLPVGEYTFKYRLRATMAGQFRVAPAVLQSMYAPEFTAYSAGSVMEIR